MFLFFPAKNHVVRSEGSKMLEKIRQIKNVLLGLYLKMSHNVKVKLCMVLQKSSDSEAKVWKFYTG